MSLQGQSIILNAVPTLPGYNYGGEMQNPFNIFLYNIL